MTGKEDSINLQFSNYKQEGLYLYFEDSGRLVLTKEVSVTLYFDAIRASQTSELKGDRRKRRGSQEKGGAASTV